MNLFPDLIFLVFTSPQSQIWPNTNFSWQLKPFSGKVSYALSHCMFHLLLRALALKALDWLLENFDLSESCLSVANTPNKRCHNLRKGLRYKASKSSQKLCTILLKVNFAFGKMWLTYIDATFLVLSFLCPQDSWGCFHNFPELKEWGSPLLNVCDGQCLLAPFHGLIFQGSWLLITNGIFVQV